jgi:hypothetical protein
MIALAMYQKICIVVGAIVLVVAIIMKKRSG